MTLRVSVATTALPARLSRSARTRSSPHQAGRVVLEAEEETRLPGDSRHTASGEYQGALR